MSKGQLLSFLVHIKSIYLSLFFFFKIKLAWRISMSMFLLLRNNSSKTVHIVGETKDVLDQSMRKEVLVWCAVGLSGCLLLPGTMIYLLHTWLHCTAFSQQFLLSSFSGSSKEKQITEEYWVAIWREKVPTFLYWRNGWFKKLSVDLRS